jgi:hypothetical protein
MMHFIVLLASASITFVNSDTKCTLAEYDHTIILRTSDSSRRLRDRDEIACVKRASAPIGVRFAVNGTAHAVRADGRATVVHDSSSIPGLERSGKESYNATLRIVAVSGADRRRSIEELNTYYMSDSRYGSRALHGSMMMPASSHRYAALYRCVLERRGTAVRLRSVGEISLQQNDVIACPNAGSNEAVAGGVFFNGSFFPVRADGTFYVVNPVGGPTLKNLQLADLQSYLRNNPYAINHLSVPSSWMKPPDARVDKVFADLSSATKVH